MQASIKKKAASVKPASAGDDDDDAIPGLKDEDFAARTVRTVSACAMCPLCIGLTVIHVSAPRLMLAKGCRCVGRSTGSQLKTYSTSWNVGAGWCTQGTAMAR
jgi:hypothetical protein